jgi:ADP-ribose pyrophosphatase
MVDGKLGVEHRGKHLEFRRAPGGWEYVSRAGSSSGVGILAITPEKRLILVEQVRPPLGGPVIELPAGLVGPDEDEAEAVRRELVEETGFECAEVRFLCRGATSPGLTDETNAMYIAIGLTPTDGLVCAPPAADGSIRHSDARGLAEEGEKILVHEVPLAGVTRWLARQQERGAVIDFRVWAGLYFGGPAR